MRYVAYNKVCVIWHMYIIQNVYTTIKLFKTSFTSHNCHFIVIVVMVRTLKLHSHSNCWALSTIVTMLYIPRTYSSYNWKFVPFEQYLSISLTSQASDSHNSTLCFYEFGFFLDSTCKWYYTVYVFLCLTCFT